MAYASPKSLHCTTVIYSMRWILFTFIIHLYVGMMATALFQAILIGALFDGSHIVTVTRQQNINCVDLFPISIIHINDFHARYLGKNFWNILVLLFSFKQFFFADLKRLMKVRSGVNQMKSVSVDMHVR